MPSKSAFSELLKRHRHSAGCSQEALAERSGLSVRAISALEQSSRRAPYRETVAALCDALGLPEDARAELEEAAASARGRVDKKVSALPAPLTSFIQRSEVGELSELLYDHRLLTITGSGGCGKTRVAIELARRNEESFDELWFIDLLPIRDGSILASDIAAQISAPAGGADALVAITRQLGSRHALLVLDNCEHLVDEAAMLVSTLLRDCPQLMVLVTSREALGLAAESVFRLPPMNAEAAAQLFVARAKAHDRALFFDAERLAIVAEICKDLDRLPLAIELAASRLPALGFDELRRRLKNSATLAGDRVRPLHHQTVVATIQWSYDLLTDVERSVFERLSVFIGGFTLAAAEALCADETEPDSIIADTVLRLVQKSLIDAELVGTATRYRFLETVRSFAWEHLSQRGEAAGTMLRLLDWITHETRSFEIDALLAGQAVFTLRRELDNVAAAVTWAIGTADPAAIVAAATALNRLPGAWYGTGRHEEVRQLLFGLLDRLRDDEHPRKVGTLIHNYSQFLAGEELIGLSARAIPLLVDAGDLGPAAANLHARMALYECSRGNAVAAEAHLATGGELLTAEERTRSTLGVTFFTSAAYARCLLGDFAGARAALEELSIRPGNFGTIEARIVRSNIEFREGHFREAFQIMEEAKAALAGHPYGQALRVMVLGNAARCALILGDVPAGEKDLREALAGILEMPDRGHLFTAVFVSFARYAAVFAAKGDRLELAMRLLGACDALTDPASLDVDWNVIDLATPDLTRLPLDRVEALRATGSREDLYDLIAEFLAD